MARSNLDDIRFVTQHFKDLQGLRYWAPLGLITLSGGGLLHFASRPVEVLLALLFPGAFLLAFGARRYYRNTFGEVEQQPVDPAADLYPVSVYSPAGPLPRLAGVHLVAPMARRLLATAALTLILFSIFQVFLPRFLVNGNESLGQRPQFQPYGLVERPWIVGNQPQPSEPFGPPWVAWIYMRVPVRPPSMLRAVFGQAMYALYGSIFLGVWLWRGCRRSQGHHLALAALLLGLSALGTFLGFALRESGGISRIPGTFLPALVYPGVALLLCGSSMVLAGLLDHWQLVRALAWPAAPEEA